MGYNGKIKPEFLEKALFIAVKIHHFIMRKVYK